MAFNKFDEITEQQIKQNGIQALADRPNLPNQYGQSGLSAGQLKACFDKLSGVLASKINEIVGTLASTDAASYIGVAMSGYESLADLITAFTNGKFAETLMVDYSISLTEQNGLQAVLNDIAKNLADYASNIEQIGATLTEHGEALVEIQDEIDNIADLGSDQFVDLSSTQTITGVKQLNGFLFASMVDVIEPKSMVIGDSVLIKDLTGNTAWYKGNGAVFGVNDEEYTCYGKGSMSYAWVPDDGRFPQYVSLNFPKEDAGTRTLATREWVEEQGFADSDALAGKLDIKTQINSVYKVNGNGAQSMASLTTNPFTASGLNYQIPTYLPTNALPNNDGIPVNGYLYCSDPIYNGQVANKKYVDEAVANGGGKLYRHSISINTPVDSANIFNCRFDVMSNRSEKFLSLAEVGSQFDVGAIDVVAGYFYMDGMGVVRIIITTDGSKVTSLQMAGTIVNTSGNVVGKYISTSDSAYFSSIYFNDTVTEI